MIINQRWLLLSVFPIGWYFSYDILTFGTYYFAILTSIALLSASLVLFMLRGPVRRKLHFWVIFIIFIIGYYIKFFILCFYKIHNYRYADILDTLYPLENELLNNSVLLLDYYEMITIVFLIFALLITFLTSANRFSKVQDTYCNTVVPSISINSTVVMQILVITIISVIVLMYIQVKLGLGYVSGYDRQTMELPYHLAGVIMTIYNGIIPLVFLVSVWLSDTINSKTLSRLTTGSYLLFGVAAGFLSTSKASLLSTVISIAVLWLVTDKLSKKRMLLLLSMVPFIVIFNGYIILNRTMRSAMPDIGIFDIALMAGQFLLFTDTAILSFGDSVQNTSQYLGFLMRINGADSLMNIINYAPTPSFDRTWFLLFESTRPVYSLFAEDVLGHNEIAGLAFSPSLLGYFTFVFGNLVFVCFGMVAYTLTWHIIFKVLLRAKLLVEPIVFAFLIVLVGHYTSEGTLESMPQSIALLILFAIIGENLVRYYCLKKPVIASNIITRKSFASEQ